MIRYAWHSVRGHRTERRARSAYRRYRCWTCGRPSNVGLLPKTWGAQ